MQCQDLGILFVLCTIDNYTFTDAMLDLGASINVMPTSVCKSLNFGDLEPTGMEIQLANRSIVQPLGVLEDVLVQVNELILPIDFYVLDMEEEALEQGFVLILGRLNLNLSNWRQMLSVVKCRLDLNDTKVDSLSAIQSRLTGNQYGFSQK
ncbi:hypothetical protein CR513_50827, partial [Mucuna pruriens]